jgi:hypothetical protein
MPSQSDPLNQKVAAVLIVHGPDAWNSPGLLGIKLLVRGEQFGFLLDQEAALEAGLAITVLPGKTAYFEVEPQNLVEGTPPVVTRGGSHA